MAHDEIGSEDEAVSKSMGKIAPNRGAVDVGVLLTVRRRRLEVEPSIFFRNPFSEVLECIQRPGVIRSVNPEQNKRREN